MLASIAGIVANSCDQSSRVVLDALATTPSCGTGGDTIVGVDGAVFGMRRICGRHVGAAAEGLADFCTGHVIAVVDGRLDNMRDVASQLGIETSSESKLLAAAYMNWGEESFARINGDFAAAVFDRIHRKLVLCRDWRGARPLYWMRTTEGGVAFGSYPVAAVVAARRTHELDPMVIWRRILGIPVISPDTIFRNVRGVSPEELLVFDSTGVKSLTRRRKQDAFASVSDAEFVDLYRGNLIKATSLTLRAMDGPLAVSVSGGLDSAVVLGVVRATAEASAEVRGVTIVPIGRARADMPYADDAIRHSGVAWTKQVSCAPDVPDTVLRHAADPMAIGRTSLACEVFDVAKQVGCRSLLLGSGGDLVGGYAGNWRWMELRQNGVRGLRNALVAAGYPRHYRNMAAPLVRAALGGRGFGLLKDLVRRNGRRDLDVLSALIAADREALRDLREELRSHRDRVNWPECDYATDLQRQFRLGVEKELIQFDHLARVYAIEIAHPLVNAGNMALAPYAPWHLCHCGSMSRLLVRRAAAGMIPESIGKRSAKISLDDHFLVAWRNSVSSRDPKLWDRVADWFNVARCRAEAQNGHHASLGVIVGIQQGLSLSKWAALNE